MSNGRATNCGLSLFLIMHHASVSTLLCKLVRRSISRSFQKIDEDRPTNLGLLDEPVFGGSCVGDSFLSSKCLGSDDEENGFGIHFLQNLRQMSSIDVRDEVDVRADLVNADETDNVNWQSCCEQRPHWVGL